MGGLGDLLKGTGGGSGGGLGDLLGGILGGGSQGGGGLGTGRVWAYVFAIPPVTLGTFVANRLWTFSERPLRPR